MKPVPRLAASLLLHAAAIALLCVVRSPELPARAPHRVVLTTFAFHPAAPVARRPVRTPVARQARAFRPPEQAFPKSPRQIAPVVADPPSLPESALQPQIEPRLELPPRILKTDSFGDAQLSGPTSTATVRAALAATGAFDTSRSAVQVGARSAITAGTFGDASIAAAGPHARRGSATPDSSTAEILFKPRPVYTEEARRLGLEGEVLLEMLFGASGEARVLSVIRGLGHGLDETAVTAASEIRFRPAQRGGVAIDSSAVVHIVFQIAR